MPKKKTQKSLDKWTKQEWTTRDGKKAIRKDSKGRTVTARYLPKAAWDKLSKSEAAATDKKKRAGSRKGRQVVKNTRKAARARRRS